MGSESEVILGVDGGTTSTVCVCMPLLPFTDIHNILDPLPILGRAVAGSSNFNSVGEDVARGTLEKVIGEALFDAGVKRSAVQAICLGLSGVNHSKDQEKILGWLRSKFPSHVKLYIQNDAVAALASGTMGKLHGCVLIAGTGSIAYGFTEDGREARAAGAGPVLGDWGSGYGIAAQALTAVMRAHDGRGPQTMLSSCILQSLGLSSPDELIGWTYADPSWARIAALVPVVVHCAEDGDQVADEILHNAVQELALSVKAVVQRLHLAGEGISELHVNLRKSQMFPVNEIPNCPTLAGILGCKVGALPTKYLGLSLGSINKAADTWDGVLDRYERRLARWKAQYLSLGGRVVLFNGVLDSLPTYVMSVFPIPDKLRKA